MHKFKLLAIVLLVSCKINSQEAIQSDTTSQHFNSDRDAKFAISQIVLFSGLEPNFQIKEDYSIKNAITKGWLQAQSIKNTTIVNFNQRENSSINEKITHRIRFNNELTSYYLNTENQLIWYDNYAKAVLICIMENSKNRNFKWEFVLEKSKYAIDYKGGIWLLSTHGNDLSVGTIEILD